MDRKRTENGQYVKVGNGGLKMNYDDFDLTETLVYSHNLLVEIGNEKGKSITKFSLDLHSDVQKNFSGCNYYAIRSVHAKVQIDSSITSLGGCIFFGSTEMNSIKKTQYIRDSGEFFIDFFEEIPESKFCMLDEKFHKMLIIVVNANTNVESKVIGMLMLNVIYYLRIKPFLTDYPSGVKRKKHEIKPKEE